MHEEEVDVAGVVDKEGLVAGGHHVAGLLVGAKTNLLRIVRIHRCPRRSDVRDGQKEFIFDESFCMPPRTPVLAKHTDGITICPLNRLRTRLSIPLGFLQLASTHL